MNYNQQISVDLVNMVYSAIAYLALAGAAWLFLRLFQACFCLPRHMKRQNDVQRMLEEKVESYERYIEECEAREAEGESSNEDTNESSLEERRKERRECLEMLKRELQRIKDGGDPYDFNYLLDDEEKKLLSDIENMDDEGVSGFGKLGETDDPDEPEKEALLASEETERKKEK